MAHAEKNPNSVEKSTIFASFFHNNTGCEIQNYFWLGKIYIFLDEIGAKSDGPASISVYKKNLKV